MKYFLLLVALFPLWAQEKPLNDELRALHKQLSDTCAQVHLLQERHAPDSDYMQLAKEARRLREEIRNREEKWIGDAQVDEEEFSALWDLGETTLPQLLMEYGSSDFLYVIPPEISSMKLSLFSAIPIPRASWSSLIELILTHNGIGIKPLNAYAKQLYLLKTDPVTIEGVTSKEEELHVFPPSARLCHIFSPPPEQIKAVQNFFERFADPKHTFIYAIGAKLAMLSNQETIEKLLQLYHVVWEKDQGRLVRLVHLSKISASEGEKVLKALFSEAPMKNRPPLYSSIPDDLITLALPQGLVLIGEKELVDRAEQIVVDLENQLDDPGEKVVFWYTCKHSDPEEIAKVLDKVYDSLIGSTLEKSAVAPEPAAAQPANTLPVHPPFVQPGTPGDKQKKSMLSNFIVDPKTASILMVIRREELNKIKTLLKRLDVPKKMVQLDVLLVEKRVQDRSQIGMNLLRMGDAASNKNNAGLSFDTSERAVDKGMLNFLLSHASHTFGAFDVTYHFLLAQDDLHINANPSVLTMNQTPATISVVEEISINNGAVPVDTNNGGAVFEKSFTRAQYGITISLTPTIHCDEEEDLPGFVSLQTDITFDTTQASRDDRPPVTRRHIVNEVRVADGETVILGGLRRKSEEGAQEKIPFLGDLPGLGKLFGLTKATDSNTEMFIFITPHIIHDPVGDLKRLRIAEYQKRPGDIPEFLSRLEHAKRSERKQQLEDSLLTLKRLY